MSRFILNSLAIILSVTSGNVLAQSLNPMTQEAQQLADARALLQAGRAEIIREEVPFTATEAGAFWPAYEKYVSDLNLVRDRQAKLISQYLEAYNDGEVSDQFAAKLLDDYLAIKFDILTIQKKHLRKFRQVLPPHKVTLFYQLENQMNAELDLQLARVIPLIDPE
jgi:hypothetical protein